MKNLISFIFLLITGLIQAQDTLVDNTGNIMSGYIMESDSNFITLSQADSVAKEMQLVNKRNIIFIRHRDGKAERNYKYDTLITMQGDFVFTKVIQIDPENISCFSYNGKVVGPLSLARSEVFMIRFADGTRELIPHEQQVEEAPEVDYYRMGIEDARKYYKVPPESIIGEFVSGMGSIIIIGLIPGVTIASVSPKKLNNVNNPNNDLLEENYVYRAGYVSVAHKRKAGACAGAFVGGLSVIIVAILAAYW